MPRRSIAQTMKSRCLPLASGVIGLVASCADSSEPRGQIMLAVSTDMAITKDMDHVVVEVWTAEGSDRQEWPWDLMPAGRHAMPGTIALVPPNSGGQLIRVRLTAKKHLNGGVEKARIVRDATVKVPTDRVALLHMPLRWLCDGKVEDVEETSGRKHYSTDCEEGETCIAGTCRNADVDVDELPDYAPGRVFGGGDAKGNGSACLDAQRCFEGADVLPVPPEGSCTVPLPAHADSLNVALVTATDGHCLEAGHCVVPLDADPVEGFRVEGSRVVLPEAACTRSGVAGIALSTACKSKDVSIPVCGPWTGWGTPDSGAGGGGNPDAGQSDGGGTSTSTGGASGGSGGKSAGGVGGGLGVGGGPSTTGGGCVGECCPRSASCYSLGSPSSRGGECMARRQNPNPLVKPVTDRITMRQAWVRVTEPPGNTIAIVYGALNAYTSLSEPACNTPNGTSGHMQLSELDLTDPDSSKHTLATGYATYVEDLQDALQSGACFGAVGGPGWVERAPFPLTTDPEVSFALPDEQMSDSSRYPKGLPKPMGQSTRPWTMSPTKAVRLSQDFNLATDRAALLESLAPDGPRKDYGGVFYLDENSGTVHGYSPLSWQLFYDPRGSEPLPKAFSLIPLREAELRFRFNDPAAPDCIGRYRSDFLTPSASCTSMEPSRPAWGGIFNTTAGESDAEISGYFLITELEQVYSKVLGSTLCVSYPASTVTIDQGFSTAADKRCRATGKFDGSKPNNEGLPMGNWCAETNSPATATCHDAYRSRSFHAFQAFKVRPQTCPALGGF